MHVPDYATCDEADLVALCDIVPSKPRALAEQWAPQARVYSDYKKMLKEEALDCLTVTLPNFLHAPVTIAGLKAGCHVLVEKPMATSAAEAQRMIDAAKRCRKLLMVNQSQRRFPAHVKAQLAGSMILSGLCALSRRQPPV